MPIQLPFVEKYRPQTIEAIYGHNDIKQTIQNLLDENNLPHLLLHGPPGTGKTSMIMACARHMYGDQLKTHMLELNASDERGINTVRNRIKQFASTGQFFDKKIKLIVLDEADMMTTDAQMALRCIIEKYARTTRFCIICNNITSIIDALQSRCLKFVFKPIARTFLSKKAREIIKKEKINMKIKPLNSLLNACSGDMRKMVNCLETLNMMSTGPITEKDVLKITDSVSSVEAGAVNKSLQSKSYAESFQLLYDLCVKNGSPLQNIISQLQEIILKETITSNTKIKLLSLLSDVEYSLVENTNIENSIGLLVSGYVLEFGTHLKS